MPREHRLNVNTGLFEALSMDLIIFIFDNTGGSLVIKRKEIVIQLDYNQQKSIDKFIPFLKIKDWYQNISCDAHIRS